jgi:hypothetical protein
MGKPVKERRGKEQIGRNARERKIEEERGEEQIDRSRIQKAEPTGGTWLNRNKPIETREKARSRNQKPKPTGGTYLNQTHRRAPP